MELYFKDLISSEASLEKLVEDLSDVVQQEAHDFAQTVGHGMPDQWRIEIERRLDRLRESCRRLKENTIAGVQATDKIVRKNPYWSLGVVAAAALAVGWTLGARKH